jgi:large subunit ribosomal protein L10
MPLTRTQKHDIVGEVQETLKNSTSLILVHNKGMTVAEVSELRRRMRAAGAEYRVVKNRLAKLALKDSEFESASDLFTGPTAMATSKDPVAAAKIAVEFAKTNEKLVIVGGSFANKVMDAKGVEALSKLPSLDELRARLVGMLQTPAQRIATLLQAPGSQVARVVSAYSQK